MMFAPLHLPMDDEGRVYDLGLKVSRSTGLDATVVFGQEVRAIRSGIKPSELAVVMATMVDIAAAGEGSREFRCARFIGHAIEEPARHGSASLVDVAGLDSMGLPDEELLGVLARDLGLQGPDVRKIELARERLVIGRVSPIVFINAVATATRQVIDDGGPLGSFGANHH
jgi:hypothetical protein